MHCRPGELDVDRIADQHDLLEMRQVEAREPVDEVGLGDEHLRPGEVERVLQVGAARGQVERRVDRSGGVGAEPGAEHVRAGGHPHGDVVAHLDADALQGVGGAPGLRRRRGVGPGLVVEERERLVGGRERPGGEHVREDALLPGREVDGRVSWGRHCAAPCFPELKSFKLSTDDGRCQCHTVARCPAACTGSRSPCPILGTVNVWLLEGDPLTLVDTGPCERRVARGARGGARGARALARGDRARPAHPPPPRSLGARRCDRGERSGARIAATAGTAAWGASYHERAALEAAFGRRLLAAHGVPADVIESSEPFWEHIIRNSANFTTTDILADGDVVRAGRPRLPGRRASRAQRHRHALRRRRATASRSSATTSCRRSPPAPRSFRSSRRGASAGRRSRSTSTGSARTAAMELDLLLPGPRARDPRPPLADRRATRVPRAAARARRRLDRRRAAARRSRSRSACGTTETARDAGRARDLGGDRAPRRARRARARRRGRRRRRQAPVPTERARERTHRQSDSDPERKERRVTERRHAKPPRTVRPHGLRRDRHRRDEGPRSRDRDRARRRGSRHRDREPQARGVRGDRGGGPPRRPARARRSRATSRAGTSARRSSRLPTTSSSGSTCSSTTRASHRRIPIRRA